MIENYRLTEKEKLKLLPPEELSKKAMYCLIDNLGYLNATEYIANVMQEGREHQSYEEWSKEFYGKMTDEEFRADLQEYIKNHPHE